uniref:Uncharacterized protein MANES_10G082000 n=1 Tax=Rhizophora mucronata TaxID=61149 RepID=A0A2P2NIP9_RHIMU
MGFQQAIIVSVAPMTMTMKIGSALWIFRASILDFYLKFLGCGNRGFCSVVDRRPLLSFVSRLAIENLDVT